ncbi:MAG TPA: 2-aminoethylphosphonate:pyruvate aminotransferase [Solibacterales bacterium]|nr:2-aminoethylphosphonate:pyruvate aminotransferase [Bryobacterales bacterium]
MDKLLFTPGPLTTSPTVKQAMLRDLGSRDVEFIQTVRRIRRQLAAIGGSPAHEAVLMQGSGTFGVESVVGSALPRDGKLLVVANGAYGKRIAAMARQMGVESIVLTLPENRPADLSEVALAFESAPTHLAIVHCETTTGLLNPVEEICRQAKAAGISTIVDAMSSFGAIPLDLTHVDYMVSSANKCLQGVPGFSFVLARREALLACEGRARSLSLDLYAQWKGLEGDGQFRFTPPTHGLLAFEQALREFEEEGGVAGRGARYAANRAVLAEGMRKLGFAEYLAPEHQGPIITSYRYPDSPDFDFERFYSALSERGCAIYPGKVSDAACFRIGTVGHLRPDDMRKLLAAVAEVWPPKRARVKAVIFDWAGTVVDYGSRAPARAFVELFRRHGVAITEEQARGPMGLHKRSHIEALLRLPHVAAALPEADLDALYAEFIPLQTSILAEHADLVPGVEQTLAALSARGIKTGATTGYNSEMMAVLAPLAAARGFRPDTSVAADQVPQGRPAPWMALQAAFCLEAWPLHACVKVGDTPADIDEGRNAGMWTVGVTLTGNEAGLGREEVMALDADALAALHRRAARRLEAAGAHFVIPGVESLPPVIDEIERRIAAGVRP